MLTPANAPQNGLNKNAAAAAASPIKCRRLPSSIQPPAESIITTSLQSAPHSPNNSSAPSFGRRHSRPLLPFSSILLLWTSLALMALTLLLVALPQQAQAAALTIPVSEMLREADEPFERDDRDYRPLQFGKRDATYRPLQFGKKSVYRPLQFGKRGGAHYWPVDAASNSRRLVIATADDLL